MRNGGLVVQVEGLVGWDTEGYAADFWKKPGSRKQK